MYTTVESLRAEMDYRYPRLSDQPVNLRRGRGTRAPRARRHRWGGQLLHRLAA